MRAVKKVIINSIICAIISSAPIFGYSQIDCSTFDQIALQNLNFDFNKDHKLDNSYTFSKTKIDLIDPNYASKYFGAFCKFENSSFKKSNIPIKFRLGNLQYVDELERKLPAYRLIQLESQSIKD